MPTFPPLVSSAQVISSAHINALRNAIIDTYGEVYSLISDVNLNSHDLTGVNLLEAVDVTISGVLTFSGSFSAASATIGTLSATAATIPTLNVTTITASGAITGGSLNVPSLSGGAISGDSLVLTGVISGLAKGHRLGTAGGTSSASPLVIGDANVILYDFGGNNWSGIGSDGSGHMWFRTGLSGSLVPALVLQTDGLVDFPRLPSTAPVRGIWYDPTDSNRVKFVP